jgi:hypothetical protein
MTVHGRLPSVICGFRRREFLSDEILGMSPHHFHAFFLKVRLFLPGEMKAGTEF